MSESKHLIIVIGTRPELIKLAPVIIAARDCPELHLTVVNTGQHRELMEPLWALFECTYDVNLDIIKPGQSLASLTSRAIMSLEKVILDATETSDIAHSDTVIMAQGDTSTVMAASICAFYLHIDFAHVEAGLRSFDLEHPFPEEFNRRVTGITTQYHFAPTKRAVDNLTREHVDEKSIYQVGNTVVDALKLIQTKDAFKNSAFTSHELARLDDSQTKNVVLITCHRRENHGVNLQGLIRAVDELSRSNPNLTFVWPVHLNPNVMEPVKGSNLNERANVCLTEPLDYLDLLRVLARCKVVLSDSGGIQEEAPSFGVPVLVLRDVTERPEAVEAGLSRLIGCSYDAIMESFHDIANLQISNTNPYGDGRSAVRICQTIVQGSLPEELAVTN